MARCWGMPSYARTVRSFWGCLTELVSTPHLAASAAFLKAPVYLSLPPWACLLVPQPLPLSRSFASWRVLLVHHCVTSWWSAKAQCGRDKVPMQSADAVLMADAGG